MDRQQKIDQINNRGRVSQVGNLKVNPTLIHPDYKSEACNGILSETGELIVLKIIPKSGDGPYKRSISTSTCVAHQEAQSESLRPTRADIRAITPAEPPIRANDASR